MRTKRALGPGEETNPGTRSKWKEHELACFGGIATDSFEETGCGCLPSQSYDGGNFLLTTLLRQWHAKQLRTARSAQ